MSPALELRSAAITVNVVPPGFMDTPLVRSAEPHLLGGWLISPTSARALSTGCWFVDERGGFVQVLWARHRVTLDSTSRHKSSALIMSENPHICGDRTVMD
jgi:NAD(P)-dependent dehydrogenase (short-subunit alcohol dehydrogenase family)